MMQTSDFDYHLPVELIAQTPLPRGESRLMVVNRAKNEITHHTFADILHFLKPEDILVRNNTRVVARRVTGIRESGSPAEVLLLTPLGEKCWTALVKPGKSIRTGSQLTIIPNDNDPTERIIAAVIDIHDDGSRILEFASSEVRDSLLTAGVSPLPPYIHTLLKDEERYQTVYSKEPGSCAAPTAGLHFTDMLISRIQDLGCGIEDITLHVGIDTFRPVKVQDIGSHVMHGEDFTISESTCEKINSCSGRVIAVGTTTVRALESAADQNAKVKAHSGSTHIFITPGYEFKVVDAMLTNFHLPKSTLIMMISAFASRELILEAYRIAVAKKYRFFSFGDAMLIL